MLLYTASSSPTGPSTPGAMEVEVESSPSRPLALQREVPDITLFDLRTQVQRFLTSLNVTSSTSSPLPYIPTTSLSALQSCFLPEEAPSASNAQLLEALSQTMAVPGMLNTVLEFFAPVIKDLLARWCDIESDLDAEEWERKLFVLAEISDLLPSVWSLIYTFLERSPFLQGTPLHFLPRESISSTPAARLHLNLLSFHRLLGHDAYLPDRAEWNPVLLMDLYSTHPDSGVRYLALQTYCRYKGVQEQVRLDMEKKWIGDIKDVEVQIAYEWEVTPNLVEGGGSVLEMKSLDGWLLRLVERERAEKYAKSAQAKQYAVLDAETPQRTRLGKEDFSRLTSVIAGSLVFCRGVMPVSHAISTSDLHIDIASHAPALRSLVDLLDHRLPILLTSEASAGKTHTIRHLAGLLYPHIPANSKILTISLADTSIDAKALIGNYVSSPKEPGTFIWAEGALVKAMRTGRWIVLEDMDRATVEVQSLFSRLADSLSASKAFGARAVLDVPAQREPVEASHDFAIIATRTVPPGPSPLPANFLGSHFYREVSLASPEDSEVEEILSRKFPTLAGAPVSILFHAYQQVIEVGKGSLQRSGRSARPYGLRDLERWCQRVTRVLANSLAAVTHQVGEQVVFSNPVVQEEVFLEAFDVFLAALDTSQAETQGRKDAFGRALAAAIGLNAERYAWLVDSRVPTVEFVGDKRARQAVKARIGRASLRGLAPRPGSNQDQGRPYATTKPSALLLERIAVGVTASEPLLLVGETGTGKTTAVQHLADSLNKPLTVLNLSMQTESGDLLGGFKPIEASLPARELHGRWVDLFRSSFSRKKNEKYEVGVRKALHEGRWKRLAEMMVESGKLAREKLVARLAKRSDSPGYEKAGVVENEDEQEQSQRKRRKLADDDVPSSELEALISSWDDFLPDADDFVAQHVTSKSRLVFAFLEGPLVKCLRNGEWLLLDEVNLASQETLESLTSVLESVTSSVILTEKGDLEPVPRHPDFRLFACMNPATDVGKKDLPPGLRARFTEIYVPPPDDDREALLSIVKQYLGDASAGDPSLVLDVAEFYVAIKKLAKAKEIVDGTNTPPHYSMRTLARALTFAVDIGPTFGVRRGLWEGCMMTFTMSLDDASAILAKQLCDRCLLRGFRNANAVISQVPAAPTGSTEESHVRFGHYWLGKGDEDVPNADDYIITPSVQSKLLSLSRTILTRKYPVLIQGPTSSGKTSAVEFLARQTGHKFIRINNHEHTDIQEYLGSYAADPVTGKLVFQEGALVSAVRRGYWIVLDELNLAPTDVLEALNRLLDDNRELILPETQEVVKPHPHFMLFATQNPPGLYAGRKVLSRAFRNRFLEVHFEDVPREELETIICQRCKIAPSYAHRIVQVFGELRHRRQATRVFESSQSFATLRDLFRWAGRDASSYQELAEHGFMLLAERSRSPDDKVVVSEVLETIMKVKISEETLYDVFSPLSAYGRLNGPLPAGGTFQNVVWTSAMRKLFTLTAVGCHFREPMLLVGETGCGKTSVCQVLAAILSRALLSVNCHQNMEAADLLGSQRPVRDKAVRLRNLVSNLSDLVLGQDPAAVIPAVQDSVWAADEIQRLLGTNPSPELSSKLDILEQDLNALQALFQWHDGPLIDAMRQGALFLLDELSLADDSVLERLNSVLEPARTLVLAEKGGLDISGNTIVAEPTFAVIATMNPGGDFGKKELSPALRNRFTEVWVPPVNIRSDLELIISTSWKLPRLEPLGPLILDFLEWFGENVVSSTDSGVGLRDILSWIGFSEACALKTDLDLASIFVHGASLIMIDGLESLPSLAGSPQDRIDTLRAQCQSKVRELCNARLESTAAGSLDEPVECKVSPENLSLGPFSLERQTVDTSKTQPFALKAPTTLDNLLRIVRACQLPKSILLEGSPGVGKTSLVSALAKLCGRELCRINLSEQTDLVDLFGADLPVTGGSAGEFAWVDAAFLTAMKRGDWVLLDEMNLASQAVLEGLNAVLDHRGTVFIPELGRSFDRHPSFRVFAAQNPLHQGGGRKGLPKSFLNRFTKVYVREMTRADLQIICGDLFPSISDSDRNGLIKITEELVEQTTKRHSFGTSGSPWEFNLRDIMRVCSLGVGVQSLGLPEDRFIEYLRLVYVQRFRTPSDQQKAQDMCEKAMSISIGKDQPWPESTPSHLQIGSTLLQRGADPVRRRGFQQADKSHLHQQGALIDCLNSGSLAIMVGVKGAGKRTLARAVAASAGRSLTEFSLHPGVDTLEMLGSFEQSSLEGHWRDFAFLVLDQISPLTTTSDMHGCQAAEMLLSRIHGSLQRLDILAGPLREVLREASDWLQSRVPSTTWLTLSTREKSLRDTKSKASFEWVDGPLVNALRSGDWFFINDANLCSGSVLDRLNSLCEVGGSLVLSERGTTAEGVPVIYPHPNFRLIMAFDPQTGELSRAMRNRGIEISFASGSEERADVSACGLLARLQLESTTEARIAQSSEKVLQDAGDHTVAASLAYLYARQAPQAVVLVTRWAAARKEQDVQQLFNLIHGSGLLQWRSLRLSCLPILGELGKFGDNLPLDFTTNRALASSPELRLLYRVLQTFCLIVTATPIQHQQSLRVTQDRESELRSLLQVFVGQLRTWISDLLSKPMMSGHEPASLMVSLMEAIAVQNSAQLLGRQLPNQNIDFTRASILIGQLRSVIEKSEAPSDLVSSLSRLDTAIRITNGLGQLQIWTAFSSAYFDRVKTLSEQRLKACLRRTDLDPKLRSSVLSLLIALSSSEAPLDTLLETLSELESMPEAVSLGTVLRLNAPEQALLLRSRLLIMADPSGQQANAQLIGNWMLDVSPVRALDWTAVIHGLSFSARSGNSFPAISDLLLSAFASEADEDFTMDASLTELSAFTAAASASTLNAGAKVADLQQQQQRTAFLAKLLLASQVSGDSRSGQLWAELAMSTLVEILGCFGDISLPAIAPTSQGWATLQQSLQGKVPEFTLAATVKWLGPALSSEPAASGLWLAVGLLLWDLYVTNIPYDPAEEYSCKVEEHILSRERLSSELEVYTAAELECTGNISSPAIVAVLEDLEGVGPPPAQPRLQRAETSDPAKLNSLFSELHALQADMLSPERVLALEQVLVQGDDSAIAQAYALQASLASLLQRLQVTYHGLDDLVAPLILAIASVRVAFSLAVRSCLQRKAVATKPAFVAMVQHATGYPSIAHQQALLQTTESAPVVTPESAKSRPLVIALATRTCDVIEGRPVAEHFSDVIQTYDKLLALWQIDQRRHAMKEQADESLYRQRKKEEEVMTEEELDAAEFEKLFPNYEKDVMDEDGDTTDKPKTSSTSDEVPDESVRLVYRLHLGLFGEQSSSRASAIAEDTDALRHRLLHDAFQSEQFAFDASFDQMAKPTSLALLAGSTADFGTQKRDRYNFYIDQNAAECATACSLLARLKARLETLIQEWPEQMVLQHIHDRCSNIGSMTATSPVARLLPAFEQLLQHTDDWETYANRDNSLKAYRDEIVNLIVAWRKLELSLWHRILPQQTTVYDEETAPWHFKVYEMLVVGMRNLDADGSGSVPAKVTDAHVASVHALLVDFMGSSTLGHFSSRLNLLRSYIKVFSLVSCQLSGWEASLAERLRGMLGNFVLFYGQYEGTVASAISKQKESLEKSVSDYVRLASWKDINVQALKASAHKSHVQLFKLIRKYREVLRQPATPHLVLAELGSGPAAPSFEELQTLLMHPDPKELAAACQARDTAGSVPSTLSRLEFKAKLFQDRAGQMASVIDRDFGKGLEDRASGMLEQMQQFAEETRALKGPNSQKLAKNLLTRKRKALADGLKDLRAIGLSSKVRADAMELQSSTARLHQLPGLASTLALDSPLLASLKRIEQYHHRLEVKMPFLRSNLAQHSDDITTHDLTRVHGMVESVFHFALSSRSRLSKMLPSLSKLLAFESRLSRCSETSLPIPMAALKQGLQVVLDARISLEELLARLVDLEVLKPDVISPGTSVQILGSALSSLDALVPKLEKLWTEVDAVKLPLLSAVEVGHLKHVAQCITEAQAALSKLRDSVPLAAFLVDPVSFHISGLPAVELAAASSSDTAASAEAWLPSDQLLERLFISVQEVSKSFGDIVKVKEDEDETNIKAFLETVDRYESGSRLGLVEDSMDNFATHLRTLLEGVGSSPVAVLAVQRVLPFLSAFIQMNLQNVSSLTQSVKASYKMCYIMCNMATDLTTKGFCQPQENSQGDGQGESSTGAGEATGFGQGTGDDNVTDDIEDEAQVEGLQGETEEEENQKSESKKDGEDNAHEMQDDFEGALEDAEDGQGSEDGEDDGEEQDGEDDLDDHVGDVGADAVDEQFWSGDKEDEKDEAEPPLDPSASDDKQNQSNDMGAKEGKQDSKKDKQEQPQDANEDPSSNPEQDEMAQDEGEEGPDDLPLDHQENETGEQPHIPEVEPLALTDDLALDDKNDDKSDLDDAGSEGDLGDLSDDDNDDGMSVDSEIGADGNDTKAGGDDEEGDPMGEDEDQGEPEVLGQDDVSAPANQADETEGSGSGGQQAQQKGQAEQEAGAEEGAQKEEPSAEETDEKASGDQTDENDKAPQATDNAPDQDETQLGASGERPDGESGQGQAENRSFGASLAEVRRLMNEILEQTAQERLESGPSAEEQQPGAVEHVAEDQDADMEALGAADEAHQQKLADLQIVDEEKGDGNEHRGMDVDQDDILEEPAANPSEAQVDTESRDPSMDDEQTEKALTRAQVVGGADTSAEGGEESDAMQQDAEMSLAEHQIQEQPEDEDEDLATDSLGNLGPSASTQDGGEDLWRRYAAMTSDLSFHLCEQLRLILEPTLATRLQGDFRTGKRLNMRKIIPYIASEYTKDKIWLRRTKPSRREYQVMLSLDDSRSMADSQSVHLAYQTMALVSQALSKLEVGQISVARFGDGMEVLHPFSDAGFSAKDGAKVISSFGFEQHRTDVAKLLDSSLEYLQESRRQQASSSSADLWQLEIIISDGVCQDHPRLRTLLRRAVEQRVMVVFVVVDSLQRNTSAPAPGATSGPSSRTSILNMQSVSYKQVNGEMKLEMERYLDTFPFEYYVVLRDVQALPEVLSDTLRQWMARVSSSEE